MIRRMVVGVTDSKFSHAAADTAIAWAQRYGAELVGVSAVDIPQLAALEAVPLGASAYKAHRDQSLIEQAQSDAEEWLAEFGRDCEHARVFFRLSRAEGDPASVLSEEAQKGDLLIVGRKRILLSDDRASETLERLLRYARRPVVAVSESPVSAPGRVLVAYDGSGPAAKTLQSFIMLGMAEGRSIHLLQVSEEPMSPAPVDWAAEYVQLHGYPVTTQIEVSRSPTADVILHEAERLGTDMIVMGTHARARVAQWIFGSVSRSVVNGSNVPIFLHH